MKLAKFRENKILAKFSEFTVSFIYICNNLIEEGLLHFMSLLSIVSCVYSLLSSG